MSKEKDKVWATVNDELTRRRLSWASFGRRFDPPLTDQTMNNWQRRRLPPSRYEEVAEKLGWTVDRLLFGAGNASEPPGADHILVSKADLTAAVFSCAKLGREITPELLEEAYKVLVALGLSGADAMFHLRMAPEQFTAKSEAEQATPKPLEPTQPAASANPAPRESAKE